LSRCPNEHKLQATATRRMNNILIDYYAAAHKSFRVLSKKILPSLGCRSKSISGLTFVHTTSNGRRFRHRQADPITWLGVVTSGVAFDTASIIDDDKHRFSVLGSRFSLPEMTSSRGVSGLLSSSVQGRTNKEPERGCFIICSGKQFVLSGARFRRKRILII
jgi:hypothetical protein